MPCVHDVRLRLSSSPLIKEDDPVDLGVKIDGICRSDSSARSTMPTGQTFLPSNVTREELTRRELNTSATSRLLEEGLTRLSIGITTFHETMLVSPAHPEHGRCILDRVDRRYFEVTLIEWLTLGVDHCEIRDRNGYR